MLSADQEHDYFISQYNFQLAWRRLNSSSILDTKDRLGLKIFSAKTNEHLAILRNTLDTDYTPSQPFFMYGPKKNGSIRIRTFLEMRDRIVYQAIGNTIIENCFDDIWSRGNDTIFAHIPTKKQNGQPDDFTFLPTFAKGGHKGQYRIFADTVQRDIEIFAKWSDVWMVETDIASFYPSLDHHLIVEMLARRGWLKNKRILDLLMKCLQHWSALTPGITSGQGVPIGYETSELLATLFLLDIDIELGLPLPTMKLRRFVDDMYVFVEGRENAKRFLVEYDLALQKRALVRNTQKSNYRLCDAEMAERTKLDREMRSKLSFVKNIQMFEDPDEAQQDIARISGEDIPCLGVCDELDLNCIREHLSTISFVLYRQKPPSEKLRRLALCILEEFPDKTIHAAAYLSQYAGDQYIPDSLLAIVERPTWYSPCRVDCMKAAIRVGGGDQRVWDNLVEWAIQNEDWYLKNAAIEILAEHGYSLRQISDQIMEGDNCYLTQAEILFRWFSQTDDTDEQIRIINLAFESDYYTLKALGIYLYRRAANISRERLQSGNLSDTLDRMLLTTQDTEKLETFADLFEDVFGFEIRPRQDALIMRRIPDIASANQFLINLQDTNSDNSRIDFIKALCNFSLQFLTAYVRTFKENPNFQAQTFYDILDHFDEDELTHNIIEQLIIMKGSADAEAYTYITVPRKNKMRKDITNVFARNLANYYQAYAQSLPPELQSRLEEHTANAGDENMRDKVFISYSHRNRDWFEKLQTHLAPLRTYAQLNVWEDTQIKAGQEWQMEIENALASAKVAVLLVTPDFLASDFITSQELPEFLRAAKDDGLTIIWIAVSSSNYRHSPLHVYQCANEPAHPLDLMPEGEQNATLVQISQMIQDAMEN